MPIYEYECTSCHHHFDLMQKFSDEPVKQCPVCFEQSVKKLISAPGFQLKGTGWYATDFKTKNTGTASESKDAKTKPSKPTESTSDASSTSVKKPSETTKGDAS